MRHLRDIFDGWMTRAAGIVFLATVAMVVFDIFSGAPEDYPLFGVFFYGLIFILFIAGGVIFFLAILRS